MGASRRSFLRAGFGLGAGAWLAPVPAKAQDAGAAAAGPLPVIHVTDFFHPHGDPDDHFDLACAYALAQRGLFDLSGVVIDYPPDFRAGDPAVVAVAQMNYLTGQAVPVAIGTSRRLRGKTDDLSDAPPRETAGVRFIIGQLRDAPRPVVLTCVGSAADIVAAALREPALFREKCAGVHLNSGTAHDNPERPGHLEHNVRLDPAAYAAMFDLPCPLHWYPCWHITERRESAASGSFYWLPHREALEGISAGLANYFAYMFEKSSAPKWLRDMRQMPPAEVWARVLDGKRGMWSTASQFAAAGLTVTKGGEIVPSREAGDAAVFRMLPVEVTCTEKGWTTWRTVEKAEGRQMLSVTDPARYPAAMARAVATLFREFV